MNKKSKVAITVVLSLLLLIIILYATGLYGKIIENYFSEPEIAAVYMQDDQLLNPRIISRENVNCELLNDTGEEKVGVVFGNVGITVLLKDYCVTIEAIQDGNPHLCEEINSKELKRECTEIASWSDSHYCEEYYENQGYKNVCYKTAIMSAYNRGISGESLWSNCFNIEPIEGSGQIIYDSSIDCLVSAAYYENDPSICENLSTESDIKECKKSAEYLIDNYQK